MRIVHAILMTVAILFGLSTCQCQIPASLPALNLGAGVQLNGLLDTYYSWNDNHPGNDVNTYHSFDGYNSSLRLNVAEVGFSRDPDPSGFEVDAGLGDLLPSLKMDVNVDAGYQRTPSGTDTWHGVAGSLQWTPTARVAISPRYEWFHDVEGFTTGTAQLLQEGTLTGQSTLARGEFRIDQSDEDVFPRGMAMVPGHQQVTGLLSLIASFGSLGR